MTSRKLKTIKKSGETISEAEIQGMYDLRLSILDLKKSINPQKDFEKFHAYAKASQFTYAFCTKKGELKGFYFCQYQKITLSGKSIVLLEPEYGFIAKEYRKLGILSITFVKMLINVALRHPFCSIYFAGTAYPASYILTCKSFERVLDAASTDFSPLEKAVFRHYQQKILADDQTIIENPTLPETTPDIVKYYQKSPYYERYIQLNPNWREGFSVIILVPISIMFFISSYFKSQFKF